MYKGYIELTLNNNEMANFYANRTLSGLPLNSLYENEYICLKDEEGKIIDKYKFQDKELKKLQFKNIKNTYMGTIKPQNFQQEIALDILEDDSITVKLIRGVYGSGKLLAPFNREIN